MSTPLTSLAEIIRPAKPRRAGDTSYPILSMTMHSGLVDQSNKFNKRVASLDTSQYRIVNRSQLVVGFPIDEGVLSFQRLYDEAIVSPAYDVWDLVDTNSVDSRYLERFLRSPRALNFYESKLRGTTARRRTLSDDVFLSLGVPIPPIEEQRKIADILDQVDALRAKRRAAIAELDSLTRSVFVEMFGDQTSKQMGWPIEALGNVAEFFGGGTLPSGIPFGDQEGGYLLLKVSDMNRDGNDKYLLGSQQWAATRGSNAATCPPNSIIIPKRGGAIGTNKKRITTRPSVLDPNLMAISPRAEFIVAPYLFGWFSQIDLTTLVSGSSVPQLNKQDLAPLRISIPPDELQAEFGRRVAKMEALHNQQCAGREKLDTLFVSLQSRAFRGEL